MLGIFFSLFGAVQTNANRMQRNLARVDYVARRLLWTNSEGKSLLRLQDKNLTWIVTVCEMHTVIRFIRMIFVSETDSAKGSVLSSPWSIGGWRMLGEEAAQRFPLFSALRVASLYTIILLILVHKEMKKKSYSIQFWVNYCALCDDVVSMWD